MARREVKMRASAGSKKTRRRIMKKTSGTGHERTRKKNNSLPRRKPVKSRPKIKSSDIDRVVYPKLESSPLPSSKPSKARPQQSDSAEAWKMSSKEGQGFTANLRAFWNRSSARISSASRKAGRVGREGPSQGQTTRGEHVPTREIRRIVKRNIRRGRELLERIVKS